MMSLNPLLKLRMTHPLQMLPIAALMIQVKRLLQMTWRTVALKSRTKEALIQTAKTALKRTVLPQAARNLAAATNVTAKAQLCSLKAAAAPFLQVRSLMAVMQEAQAVTSL